MEIRGKAELDRKLQPATVKKPMEEGLKKIAAWLLRTLQQSTPVGPSGGRYRSSLTQKITDDEVTVGTNLQNPPYPVFVEYGHRQHVGQFVPVLQKRLVTPWVAPSRVAPGTSIRKRDMGPFTYTFREAKGKINDWLKEIGQAIQVRFG